ncbi:MAG TPA: nuclear transport factor 2 family protein [Acidimicrobiales bacterium]|nr:nuclear transport factor 2 family protein [Acidimicrobiales bacterium]
MTELVDRMEVTRIIRASPAEIFAVLCDPQGHVAIDSSGMLQGATGERVTAVGDSFVVHMDREALNDFPLGEYDVTVSIRTFEPNREIAWDVLGRIRPQIGHFYGYRLEPASDGDGTAITSYYDWSQIDPTWREAGIFPVMSEGALRATLGVLARTVAAGRVAPSNAGADQSLRVRREAVVREHMDAENRLEFDSVMATFAHPRYELMATGQVFDGESEVREYFRRSRALFPDQHNENAVLRSADDAVVAEFDLVGTDPGGGRSFRSRMVALFLFDPGADRIVCERVYFDTASIAAQLTE